MLIFDQNKLKEGRVLQGYTIQEVADQLEIDLHGYWRLEKGKTELKVYQLLKLSEIFKQPIEYFLTAKHSIDDVKNKINELKLLYEKENRYILDDKQFSDGLGLIEQSLSIN